MNDLIQENLNTAKAYAKVGDLSTARSFLKKTIDLIEDKMIDKLSSTPQSDVEEAKEIEELKRESFGVLPMTALPKYESLFLKINQLVNAENARRRKERGI